MTGSDFEENIEQLAYEQSLVTKLGLDLGDPAVLAGKIAEKGEETNGTE